MAAISSLSRKTFIHRKTVEIQYKQTAIQSAAILSYRLHYLNRLWFV